jgi:hypothetical protein
VSVFVATEETEYLSAPLPEALVTTRGLVTLSPGICS